MAFLVLRGAKAFSAGSAHPSTARAKEMPGSTVEVFIPQLRHSNLQDRFSPGTGPLK